MSKKVTPHLLKVFHAFQKAPTQWMTVEQVANKSSVNYNTTKSHVRFLTKQQVLEVVAEMIPRCYKLSDAANEYADELKSLVAIADVKEGC